jgi:hypothetical protein
LGFISHREGQPMPSFPESTIKVTSIESCGEDKVCISIELVVDVHRMVDVGSKMVSVAARGAAKKKK